MMTGGRHPLAVDEVIVVYRYTERGDPTVDVYHCDLSLRRGDGLNGTLKLLIISLLIHLRLYTLVSPS